MPIPSVMSLCFLRNDMLKVSFTHTVVIALFAAPVPCVIFLHADGALKSNGTPSVTLDRSAVVDTRTNCFIVLGLFLMCWSSHRILLISYSRIIRTNSAYWIANFSVSVSSLSGLMTPCAISSPVSLITPHPVETVLVSKPRYAI